MDLIYTLTSGIGKEKGLDLLSDKYCAMTNLIFLCTDKQTRKGQEKSYIALVFCKEILFRGKINNFECFTVSWSYIFIDYTYCLKYSLLQQQ